jgi:hypothetical protein
MQRQHICLPDLLFRRLRAFCEIRETTISAVIRLALEQYLTQNGG